MNAQLKLLLFSLMCFVFIGLFLYAAKKLVKTENNKRLVFLFITLSTVLIHYSIMLYQYAKGLEVEIGYNMFLPAYPCNVMMWVSFVLAFLRTDSRGFDVLKDFVAYVGTVCGVAGLMFNINFLNNPVFDFENVKSLVSHATMIAGCLYLFTMKYVKVDTIHNVLSCLIGSTIFVASGLYTNFIVEKVLLDESMNAMFMNGMDKYTYINFFPIGLVGLLLLTIFTTVYETICYEKNERWYEKIRKGVTE